MPVDPFATAVVGVVRVPEPSGASKLMLGEEPRFVSEPLPVERSCVCQVCDPVLEAAVAPAPPPPVSP